VRWEGALRLSGGQPGAAYRLLPEAARGSVTLVVSF
jgi:hypothetical protein